MLVGSQTARDKLGSQKGKSPNRSACIPGFGLQNPQPSLTERSWEDRPERVKAPYVKGKEGRQDPEYHETRETLWEVGGTTPQG